MGLRAIWRSLGWRGVLRPSIAAAVDGHYASVSGRAGGGPRIHAPISGELCLAWWTQLIFVDAADPNNWHQLRGAGRCDELYLEDRSGRARFASDIELSDWTGVPWFSAPSATDRLLELIDNAGAEYAHDEVRYRERVLREGDMVHAAGTAEWSVDPTTEPADYRSAPQGLTLLDLQEFRIR